MRVVMVIQAFAPRIGGAERQLQALAPRLRERGVDVHVVTRRYPELAAFEHVDGIPVHRVVAPGRGGLASLVHTAAAIGVVRRLRPDVIHAHELLSPTTIAVAAGALTRTPVVAKLLISGEIDHLRGRTLGRARWRRFRRQVDRFVAITGEIDGELAAAGVPAHRRVMIPNGVDTDRLVPPTVVQRQHARQHLDLGPATPVAVAVGRLEPQKDLPTLLRAWPTLRRGVPDAQLLLAGVGSLEPELRALAGEGVRFLGAVEDVREVLWAADAFVLPSQREGLSNALLEAMASGCAVVASDLASTREVLGEAGIRVAPGDEGALAEVLVDVLSDPARAVALGRAARDRVVTAYALDAAVDALHGLYHELTDREVVV